MQVLLHYFLHLVFPAFIARWYQKKDWLKSYGILLLTMLVDLDHLLSTPVFVANRCSINFHPLHSYVAIAVYVVGLLFSRTRLVAIGLLFHMLTDAIDCFLSSQGG